MNKRRNLNWFKLVLHLAQIASLLTCSFVAVKDKFTAVIYYKITLESQEKCMMACYQDSDCTFVQYEASTCTVFKQGSNAQQPNAETYQIYRQEERSSCHRSMKVGQEVTFETVQAKSSDSSKSCTDDAPDAPIVVYRYSDTSLRFYSTDSSGFVPGRNGVQRLWLTKNPDPQCTAVPVFAQANYRRLFFGNVYNTTGYYFLNAYAFAEHCVCSSGKCCGTRAFREYVLNAESFVYRPITEATLSPSNVDQTFFAAAIGEQSGWTPP
ncbi:hypothetical protein RB195_013706 [Necator americanus]|uniref:PAN-3 domain-containing protein n=1 Tax=Necator americanus TaxID=51031 RepID=A0ABR1DWU6_NECAM